MIQKEMNKTYFPKGNAPVRNWYIVDATDKIFGRMISKIVKVLMGKHKAIYTPHADCGDYVVVINAGKVKVTGNKRVQKIKFHHSGYPGGAKYENFGKMLDEKPQKAIMRAVQSMLPKTRLGSKFLTRVRVYKGDAHQQKAQKLINLEI